MKPSIRIKEICDELIQQVSKGRFVSATEFPQLKVLAIEMYLDEQYDRPS